MVSIPYRDDKNKKKQSEEYAFVIEFQSLIGTIKTLLELSLLPECDTFQSLIGTIKTCLEKMI